MPISNQKKGTWKLEDTYKRISADCWSYASTDSGNIYLYYMGRGAEGQFGVDDVCVANIGYPQQLPGNDWEFVNTNNTYRGHVGKKQDGSYWAVGNNDYGKFGTSDGCYRSSPTQIPGTWCFFSVGINAGAGIKEDGSLWTWGYGNHGQRGLATATCTYTNESCCIPERVGTENNWIRVNVSYYQDFGIKSDNTAWVWGYNGHGELGVSNTSCYSSPIQLAGTWCFIEGSYPVVGKRTDGSYWIWGHNNHGQLGNNNTTNYSSPIALPGTWIQVRSGLHNEQMAAGIKNDNTLWTWGYNGHGELGQGDTFPRSSPVQVPGSWLYVAGGHRHVVAIKCDGTLWGWGHNTSEQRYHCSAIDFCSPIQLPGTNWKAVVGSYDGTYVYKCGILLSDEN